MAKLIAVFGATGNQGGSVAKLLLQHPAQYTVRAITRDPSSPASQALASQGAHITRADLTVPSSLPAALDGCWGVFGVTNFYDSRVRDDDPGSEEQQGRNLVDAAAAARSIECLVWSTLPSSREVSGGRFVSRIYEGKYHVDEYIRERDFPACFLYTVNFYENMVLRAHMRYDAEADTVEFRQPVVNADTRLAMLFVEKDLRGIAKAVFDRWDEKKYQLNHRRVTGKDAVYVRLETTGWEDRDVMFQLYNECGMYGDKKIPDENVLDLGVELHGIEDFVRSRLLPHLGLTAVDG